MDFRLKTTFVFFLVLLSIEGLACDACGSTMAGAYNGIYPQFTNNLLGFQYSQTRFKHPNTSLNYNGSSRVLEDQFERYEFWARFYPSSRIQVLAFVPYQVNTRKETERTTQISGIGDMTIRANYAVVNTGDSLNRIVKHTLLAGIGITLPTGKYQARDETQQLLPAQFQIGTGAFSYSLNLNYTFRYKAFGVNTDINYVYGDINERSYQFGEGSSLALAGFYWFKPKGFSVLPNIGWSMERYEPDTSFEEKKDDTGGDLQFVNAGVDINVKRFFLRFYAQKPIFQDLPYSQPESGLRWNMGLSLVF